MESEQTMCASCNHAHSEGKCPECECGAETE